MTPPHSHLRALALAAATPTKARARALEALHAACSPCAVLALLDELERVKEGLREVLERLDDYARSGEIRGAGVLAEELRALAGGE